MHHLVDSAAVFRAHPPHELRDRVDVERIHLPEDVVDVRLDRLPLVGFEEVVDDPVETAVKTAAGARHEVVQPRPSPPEVLVDVEPEVVAGEVLGVEDASVVKALEVEENLHEFVVRLASVPFEVELLPEHAQRIRHFLGDRLATQLLKDLVEAWHTASVVRRAHSSANI